MALTALDDFEEGPDGGSYPDDPSGVSLMRRTGYALAGGEVYSFTAQRPGGTSLLAVYDDQIVHAGTWSGLLGSGARANFGLDPADGLGLHVRRGDRWASEFEIAGGSPADTTAFVATVRISWASLTGPQVGSVTVDIGYGSLSIRTFWADDVTDGVETFVVPVATPTVPADRPVIVAHPDWLDFGVSLDGWYVRASGVTVASGALPVGPGGIGDPSFVFEGLAHSNLATTSTDERRNARIWIDDIYGWPGSLGAAPAVRLYPRDDGRGMSSAPRHWPQPKNARIIGNIQ